MARKGPAGRCHAPLQQRQVGCPMEQVAVDALGPFPRKLLCSGGNALTLPSGPRPMQLKSTQKCLSSRSLWQKPTPYKTILCNPWLFPPGCLPQIKITSQLSDRWQDSTHPGGAWHTHTHTVLCTVNTVLGIWCKYILYINVHLCFRL